MTYRLPAAASPRAIAAVLIAMIALLSAGPAAAQYFGRNKVQYEDFKFKILRTEHFDIYFYPAEREAVEDAARMAERWYYRLGHAMNRGFVERKPIILYANQPDFQQTNVVEGQLDEGTGGVTESIKNRVVLPLTGIYRENDHVIGHELTHVFQYDIAGAPGDTLGFNIDRLPLWLIEGMAEYMSLGREHPLTAMWLRDAVLNKDFPSINQLGRDPGYFPYRFGHALWAYIGGRWGDAAVNRIFRQAGRVGVDEAIHRELGLTLENLSKEWKDATFTAYQSAIAERTRPADAGRRLIGKGQPRDLNVAPEISPDGRTLAFFSQRDIFNIDLYLADAQTGKILHKLVTSRRNPHFDAMRFIDSAGSWSPDGRKFAFVVYAGGNNQLVIADVASGRIERRIRAPEIDAIANPAWSPDGGSIAFSGSTGGLSDLFVIDLSTGAVRRLTSDRFADLQPAWSPDGATIAFTTDRHGTDLNELAYAPLQIGLIPAAGGDARVLSLFPKADHINPVFTPDGRGLYFIADPDGVPDIYVASLQGGAIRRVTSLATGVSGITDLAPALSVARSDGRLYFSVFERRGYTIHSLAPDATPSLAAEDHYSGHLPPASAGPGAADLVDNYLGDPATGLPAPAPARISDYSGGLGVDMIGAAASGLIVDRFGTSLGGAVGISMSDMLGNRNFDAAIQANGSFKDVGGQAVYLNRAHRWNWGVGAGHIPYLSVFTTADTATVNVNGQPRVADVLEQHLDRTYVDNALFISSYPFSTTQRLEFSGGYTHYGFNSEVQQLFIVDNQELGTRTVGGPSPGGIDFFSTAGALVGDNSFFGFTSPVKGGRYRFEVEPTFGMLQMVNVLADYRKYVFLRPVTVAFRAFHYGRYGKSAEDNRLNPLFIGYPTLVRGYSQGSFDPSVECTDGSSGACPQFDRLIGSRVAVANLELRIPLFGTKEFGLIRFPFLPTELSGFIDAGAAWSRNDPLKLEFSRSTADRVPVFSTGVSARVNIFGALVGEVFYAYPFQRPDKGGHFGFQISPGW